MHYITHTHIHTHTHTHTPHTHTNTHTHTNRIFKSLNLNVVLQQQLELSLEHVTNALLQIRGYHGREMEETSFHMYKWSLRQHSPSSVGNLRCANTKACKYFCKASPTITHYSWVYTNRDRVYSKLGTFR